MTAEEIQNLLPSMMSKKRYEHTLAVKKQGVKLAKLYGEDVEKTKQATLLHDITKEMSLSNQLQMIEKSDIMVSNIILSSPQLYHAYSGSIYIKDELSINDEDIINAVRYHTIARAGMSKLEKIVYVADATSTDRDYKHVDKFRKLAQTDLDLCLYEILKHSIRYLVKDECFIPNDTLECYNEYTEKLVVSKKQKS